jgi:hypothetical protein
MALSTPTETPKEQLEKQLKKVSGLIKKLPSTLLPCGVKDGPIAKYFTDHQHDNLRRSLLWCCGELQLFLTKISFLVKLLDHCEVVYHSGSIPTEKGNENISLLLNSRFKCV